MFLNLNLISMPQIQITNSKPNLPYNISQIQKKNNNEGEQKS